MNDISTSRHRQLYGRALVLVGCRYSTDTILASPQDELWLFYLDHMTIIAEIESVGGEDFLKGHIFEIIAI